MRSALGSHDQAVAYLTNAIEVSRDIRDHAELLERVGDEQFIGGRLAEAAETSTRAAAAFRDAGDRLAALRATVSVGKAHSSRFAAKSAIEVLTSIADEIVEAGDAELSVRFQAQLGRAYMFAEDDVHSIEWIERALVGAERLGLLEVIADALVTKGVLFSNGGRIREAVGLLEAGEHLAVAIGSLTTRVRANINLTATLSSIDPRASAELAQRASEMCRRLGLRHAMVIVVGNGAEAAITTGDVSWAAPAIEELLAGQLDASTRGALLGTAIQMHALLGRKHADELRELEAIVAASATGLEWPALVARMWVALTEADLSTAIDLAPRIADLSQGNSPSALSLGARAAVLESSPGSCRGCSGTPCRHGRPGPDDRWPACGRRSRSAGAGGSLERGSAEFRGGDPRSDRRRAAARCCDCLAGRAGDCPGWRSAGADRRARGPRDHRRDRLCRAASAGGSPRIGAGWPGPPNPTGRKDRAAHDAGLTSGLPVKEAGP